MSFRQALLCLLAFAFSVPSLAWGKKYRVYYLGGQSNMDGFGLISDLPAELREPMAGVMIFHGNSSADSAPVDGRGKWTTLTPGHGAGFTSDGSHNSLSDRFGVELTFARQWLQASPEMPIALIKYSRGGTSIDAQAAGGFGCWEPDYLEGEGPGKGINQYDHFLATVRQAMSVRDIDGDGEPDELEPAGIVWMQGESDAAYSPEIAHRYPTNLKRLIDLVRAALRQDDLPVVIGRISDSGQDGDGKVWDQGSIVRAGQAEYVQQDGFAALVTSTDSYQYSDPWHYDSHGFLDLGRQFADAMLKLNSK